MVVGNIIKSRNRGPKRLYRWQGAQSQKLVMSAAECGPQMKKIHKPEIKASSIYGMSNLVIWLF